MVQDAEKYKRKLDLEERLRRNGYGCFVGWHNLLFFVVPPAMSLLFYGSLSVFWNEIESLWLLHMMWTSSLVYYNGMMFGDDDHNTSRVQRIVALEFVVLTLGSYHQTVFHGI